jgi:asparagine synthase (glutamine-hydrolysing)
VIEFKPVGRPWSSCGATHACGYAHLGDRFLRADAIAALLDACPTDAVWQETMGRLNGCFAVVTRRGAKLLAGVDRIRSIPLFFSSRGTDCFVSDDAYLVLAASGSSEPNPMANAEFPLTGYVTGEETLYTGVRQVQAGCILRFDGARPDGPQRLRYYEFRHGGFFADDSAALVARLDEVHGRVFRRLLASLEGRSIVVPLSGGYDSRLIAVALRELDVKDVVCYSYGVPGNWESRVSKELADHLGFRWEFVPYSPERWRAWASTEAFREYFRSAGNLTSVPHIQDWPAVSELGRQGKLPAGAVFIPGHTGDFVTGGHVPKWYVRRPRVSRREVLDSICRAHYSLWEWPSGTERELTEAFDRRIERVIGPIPECSPEQAADLYECWELQERQAKFICNALRVYESFGHEWRLPWYDAELMDFWSRVPIELRTGRALYLEYVRQRQALPVTDANRDRSALGQWVIEALERAGLRPAAKRVQRVIRRWRWRREYDDSPLAWYSLVDRDLFARTYTGRELIHSYLARQYAGLAAGAASGPSAATPRDRSPVVRTDQSSHPRMSGSRVN